MSRREAFARFVGDVWRKPITDERAGQYHPCARWQAAMDTTGQKQDAGGIAARLRQVYPGVERAALTLERETVGFGLAIAGFDFGGPLGGVDAAAAQDPAEAGRDLEIGRAPGVDDDRKLARGLPVEDCDQPL